MAFSAVGALNWMREAQANYREDQIRQDNLRARREDQLLGLYLKNGGTYGSSTRAPKYQGAAEYALKLQDRVNKTDMQDQELISYYGNILKDPMAAQDVMEFLEEQEEKFGRVIPLEDVPQYINIINTPNLGVQEKIDIFKELDMVDLTNKKEYYELASKIQNMTKKPGRTVFTDLVPGSRIDTGANIELAEKQYKAMNSLLVPVAQTWLGANTDPANPQAIATANALKNINSTDEFVAADARKYLFETYTTKEFVTNLMETQPEFFRGLDNIPPVKTLLESQQPFETKPKETTTRATPPATAKAMVTAEMAQQDPSLAEYVGRTVTFEQREDGRYYPVLQ
jgi:hypothetical protein